MTITEALAEIKTIDKRIAKKQEFILSCLWRPDSLRDPLEREGGSEQMIKAERQAISDLRKRIVALRTAIAQANRDTTITIGPSTRSIEEWLVWRREVEPGVRNFHNQVRMMLNQAHTPQTPTVARTGIGAAMARNLQASGATALVYQGDKPPDSKININETEFAAEVEELENIKGQLDGQLSLKNATIQLTNV